MPWRKMAEMSPDFARYLNYAVVVLSLTAEILRAYIRSRGVGGGGGTGSNSNG